MNTWASRTPATDSGKGGQTSPAPEQMQARVRDVAAPPVIDRTKVESLRQAMGEDFAELIPAYLGDVGAILAQLPVALEGNDTGEVRRLAHSLKSTSANVGAIGLSGLAAELENRAKEGDLSDAAQRIESLAPAFEMVRQTLKALFGEQAAT